MFSKSLGYFILALTMVTLFASMPARAELVPVICHDDIGVTEVQDTKTGKITFVRMSELKSKQNPEDNCHIQWAIGPLERPIKIQAPTYSCNTSLESVTQHNKRIAKNYNQNQTIPSGVACPV